MAAPRSGKKHIYANPRYRLTICNEVHRLSCKRTSLLQDYQKNIRRREGAIAWHRRPGVRRTGICPVGYASCGTDFEVPRAPVM